MGIFSILEKDADSELINDTERMLRSEYSVGAKEVLNRFVYLKGNPQSRIIEPFSLYATVINVLVMNSSATPERYIETLSYGESVYKDMFPYEEKTPAPISQIRKLRLKKRSHWLRTQSRGGRWTRWKVVGPGWWQPEDHPGGLTGPGSPFYVSPALGTWHSSGPENLTGPDRTRAPTSF